VGGLAGDPGQRGGRGGMGTPGYGPPSAHLAFSRRNLLWRAGLAGARMTERPQPPWGHPWPSAPRGPPRDEPQLCFAARSHPSGQQPGAVQCPDRSRRGCAPSVPPAYCYPAPAAPPTPCPGARGCSETTSGPGLLTCSTCKGLQPRPNPAP